MEEAYLDVDKYERQEHMSAARRAIKELERELALVAEYSTLREGAVKEAVGRKSIEIGAGELHHLQRDKSAMIDRSYITVAVVIEHFPTPGEISSQHWFEHGRSVRFVAGTGRPLFTQELSDRLRDVICERRLLGRELSVESIDPARAQAVGTSVYEFLETCLAYWQEKQAR